MNKGFSAFILVALSAISCRSDLLRVQGKAAVEEEILMEVANWNQAHNDKNVSQLSSMYMSSVDYYGTQTSVNEILEDKLALFKKYPDYHQRQFGDVSLEEADISTVKINFVKRVTLNQQTKDYPSYLQLRRNGAKWMIEVEGDRVTDHKLASAKMLIVKTPDDAIRGDFNGDGKTEFMWVEKPKRPDPSKATYEGEFANECVGECDCYIRFSDQSIPSIKVKGCIGGISDNLGDLNGNSIDEIGLLPDWFQSCWHSYRVWTFIEDEWVYAVEPISTHCNQWGQGIKPIEKDRDNEGKVIIRYSEHSDSGIEVRSESIDIMK